MKSKKKKRIEVKRMIEYAITGGAWFWSGYAMFALLYSIFHADVITAKIVSYIFGLLVNFILERFWVFGDTHAKKHLQSVTYKYVLLSILNLAIDVAVYWTVYFRRLLYSLELRLV